MPREMARKPKPVAGDAPLERSSERSAAQSDVAPTPSTVMVTWGPVVQSFDLQGMTLRDARDTLAQPFNIAPDAVALVNGERVGADHVLREGDALEFVRAAGEKGQA